MRPSNTMNNIGFLILSITVFILNFSILKADTLSEYPRIEVPGYSLQKIEKLSFRDSLIYHWTHNKTGAEIIFVKNQDQHRFFSIGFRTFSEDDTGSLHVLEHSIMQGSKNYPIDFRKLGNLNISTHFGAGTNWNRTVYEFSSNNSEASFINQSNVLCDYVFNPMLKENPYIFYQEGIRREFEDGKLKYNGVVFNEMVGARSIWRFKIYNFMRTLFPNSYISKEHGGEPTKIPNLTYSNLIKTYDKFYYPSNSLLFFYGDIDIVERLQSIDRDHLSKYPRRSPVILPELNPIDPGDNIGVQIIPSAQKFLNDIRLNRVFTPSSPLDDFTIRIILPELFNADSSPIKKALLYSKLFPYQHANIIHLNSTYTWMYLTFNMNKGKNPYQEVINIENYLSTLIQKGIDPSIIREILMRQKYSEKTLHHNDGNSLKDEIYIGWADYNNPFERLYSSTHIDTLLSYTDEKLSEYIGYLIDEYILKSKIKYNEIIVYDPKHYALYNKRIPHKAYDEYRRASSETIQKLQQIELDTKKFISKRNNNPDLHIVPSIGVKDLKDMIDNKEAFLPKVLRGNRGTYLTYDSSEDEISHLVLYFDISLLTEEEIMYLSLISTILKSKISSYFRSLYTREDKDLFLFTVKINFLKEHQKEYLKKVRDVLYLHSFTDQKFIIQLIKNGIAHYNSSRLNGSHVESFYSQQDYFISLISGIRYTNFLKLLLHRINNDPSFSIAKTLKDVLNKVLTSSHVSVGIASNQKEIPEIIKDFETIFNDIAATDTKFGTKVFNLEPSKNIGITSQQNIYQVLQSVPLKIGINSPLGYVLQTIPIEKYLLLNYLYPHISYEGGAYMATLFTSQDKVMKIYSKDDPNVFRTLEIIRGIPSFMETTTITDSDDLMTKIATISDLFPPLTPFDKAQNSWYKYFCGISETEFKDSLTTMIEVDLSTLVKDCVDMFSEGIDSGSTTIVGNKEGLKKLKEQGLIDKIIQ